MLSIGKPALDFTLAATGQKNISLSDYKNKQHVVLYFYPRDNTPGCTQEGIDFAAQYDQFKKLNTEVLGISRDTVACHEKFREKFAFPFPLLADPDEVVCQLYGVMQDKMMYGKKVRGIERSTFVIDKNGILRHEWRKVKVDEHVAEVLAAIKDKCYTA
jgi:peroxiredoxin Q/BCP